MPAIKSISFRKVLNSHVDFTNEFRVELGDGSLGQAASSQGETISIYEDKKAGVDPQALLQRLANDRLIGAEIDQAGFDGYLDRLIPIFGRNNAFALSEAFFNAACRMATPFEILGRPKARLTAPRLSLNILNGGWHAYTNPVLSDFSEFMLVAKSLDITEVIGEHNEIQRLVREAQLGQPKVVVSGNPVNCFASRDNREVIDFLLSIVDRLGLSAKYDLMIDASAGDLWTDEGYRFGITDGRIMPGEELANYWLGLIRDYPLRFLEDPFREQDFAGWQALTAAQQKSYIIGDNLYSSDERRILEGAAKKYANAAVIKPNQAGTVTAVLRSIEAARHTGQIIITSHRSISTESTFLSLLSCLFGAEFIKIGPLPSDYSSVIRLNEIIRLTEERDGG